MPDLTIMQQFNNLKSHHIIETTSTLSISFPFKNPFISKLISTSQWKNQARNLISILSNLCLFTIAFSVSIYPPMSVEMQQLSQQEPMAHQLFHNQAPLAPYIDHKFTCDLPDLPACCYTPDYGLLNVNTHCLCKYFWGLIMEQTTCPDVSSSECVKKHERTCCYVEGYGNYSVVNPCGCTRLKGRIIAWGGCKTA